MSVRFSERNSKYITALDALDPGSENFLDEGKVKPLLDLTNTEMIESQCTVARQFWQTFSTGQDEKITCQTSFKLLQRFPSHARGSDCPKTRTNIWGLDCYVRELSQC